MSATRTDVQPIEIQVCGTCKRHSPKDACCELTGQTKHKDDAACMEWSVGKVESWGERERRAEA